MAVSFSCILIASWAPNFTSLCKMCVLMQWNISNTTCSHLSLKGRTLTATVTHESSPSFSGIVPGGTMTLGIIGLSFLLAPVKASWLMLRSRIFVVRLAFEGNEDALVLDLSKEEVGLLVDGTLGSCRRFLEPGLPI